MAEQTPRTLNHFALMKFRDPHFSLSPTERKTFHTEWLKKLQAAARRLDIYQVFPTQSGADLLIWSAVEAEDPGAVRTFMEAFACAVNPYRNLVEAVQVFWGLTKPSQYTKVRSAQEIDPFDEQRKHYFVLYPFVKTKEWYLMSRDARQGMMNEHIRIGKQYPEIKQLLLYSFGLQDQEFIVTYEMDDLAQFSDLVYELRDSEARRYTERDTPLFTALYHPAEASLALWEA